MSPSTPHPPPPPPPSIIFCTFFYLVCNYLVCNLVLSIYNPEEGNTNPLTLIDFDEHVDGVLLHIYHHTYIQLDTTLQPYIHIIIHRYSNFLVMSDFNDLGLAPIIAVHIVHPDGCSYVIIRQTPGYV